MIKESWEDIPDYIGYYQVSSLGRVRSLERKVRHRGGGFRTLNGKFIKSSIGSRGYHLLALYKEGNRKIFEVHQLVAMAFLGHTPCGHKIVVDHIDNDNLNNSVSNLQLISQRENSSKDKSGGTSKYVGVRWTKRSEKWRSEIKINGKKKHLGYFSDEHDAHIAYQNALKNKQNSNFE